MLTPLFTPCRVVAFFPKQVCVPDWPFFNRNPLAWQAAVADTDITCIEDQDDQIEMTKTTNNTNKVKSGPASAKSKGK
jgi:hypothetical protein